MLPGRITEEARFGDLTCRFDIGGLGGHSLSLARMPKRGLQLTAKSLSCPCLRSSKDISLKLVASVHFSLTKLVPMLCKCQAIRRCRQLSGGDRAQQRRDGTGLLT